MSNWAVKKSLYRNARIATGLNKRAWGRLFALGNVKNTSQVVGHKENPQPPGSGTTSKGVNMSEALAAQLLLFIHDQGFDVVGIVFSDTGEILDIPSGEDG